MFKSSLRHLCDSVESFVQESAGPCNSSESQWSMLFKSDNVFEIGKYNNKKKTVKYLQGSRCMLTSIGISFWGTDYLTQIICMTLESKPIKMCRGHISSYVNHRQFVPLYRSYLYIT